MFNKLTFSYLNTSLGFWLAGFLIPLVILDLSHSAFLVTVSYAVNIVPYILVTPFAGAFGDLFNRKRIIMFGEACCALVGLIIYLIPFTQGNIAIIIFLGFVISCFAAIHHPIFQTIIPDVFSQERIKVVNSNIGVIDSLVSIIAPAFLGFVLIGFDKKVVSLVVFVCYFISFATFSFIPYVRSHAEARFNFNRIFCSLKEGVLYVLDKKELRNIAILFFAVNFGIRLVLPNLMWIFGSFYHLTDEQIAPYYLIIGIGAIVGAKVAVPIIGKVSDIKIISYCTLFTALFSFLLLLTSNALMVAIVWAFSSFVQSIIVVTFFTYRQKITETFILGRVVSVTRLISYLAIPIATIVSGWFIDHTLSIDIIYLASGFVILLSFIFFVFANSLSQSCVKSD
ncbi:MFS transporter [Gibbsiella dentisursi]|uniref:MFS transporter n=1 Tax=Gibbsiella dentisursi TaxID=796890 RepID=A0ABP7L803_9GAMM